LSMIECEAKKRGSQCAKPERNERGVKKEFISPVHSRDREKEGEKEKTRKRTCRERDEKKIVSMTLSKGGEKEKRKGGPRISA